VLWQNWDYHGYQGDLDLQIHARSIGLRITWAMLKKQKKLVQAAVCIATLSGAN
jgi:hypothetical protein